MALLRTSRVRVCVVDLLHVGTEIEDLDSLLPEQKDRGLHRLLEDALACLASCEPYDFNAEKWITHLLPASGSSTTD